MKDLIKQLKKDLFLCRVKYITYIIVALFFGILQVAIWVNKTIELDRTSVTASFIDICDRFIPLLICIINFKLFEINIDLAGFYQAKINQLSK